MTPAFNPVVSTGQASANSVNSAEENKIISAAREFESILIRHMLQQMRNNSMDPYRDQTTSSYVDMADDHFAKVISSEGGFGFGDAMARQLIHQISAVRK